MINRKKICGILQETIIIFGKKYLIIGIGINLIKSPYIRNYPTTNLSEIVNRNFKKKEIENKLKKIFEIKFKKFYD